jgi:hypothetical protein
MKLVLVTRGGLYTSHQPANPLFGLRNAPRTERKGPPFLGRRPSGVALRPGELPNQKKARAYTTLRSMGLTESGCFFSSFFRFSSFFPDLTGFDLLATVLSPAGAQSPAVTKV